MYAIDLLKSAVEGLAEPDTLSDHPLTAAKFVDHYASRHPEAQSLPRGEILGWALADLWRERCLPPTLRGRLKREWNLFLTLEVGYFYPFRHDRPFPGGLPQLGGLLLDRDHVALVIADGDEIRAQTLLQSDYADLWQMLALLDRKEALALGISTISARRDAALRRLAKELEKLETQREAATPRPAASPVMEESNPPSVAPPVPSDTLTLYRDYLQSSAPTWMPDEWTVLLGLSHTEVRFGITGVAGSGKTGLMRAIAQQVGQINLIPLYLPVCEYARHVGQLDVVQFVAQCSGFGQLYREEDLQQDLEKRLAEAQRCDRLILLADQVDELDEAELIMVSRRLQLFPRLIVAERMPRLAPLCGITCHQPLSDLSRPSATVFLQSHGYDSETAQQCVTQFQQWNIPLQPGLLRLVAQAAPSGQRHPVLVVQQWINKQLTATTPAGKTITKADQAQRLLRYLAGVKYDIAPHPEASTDLTRENVRRAFWSLGLTPDKEEQGWSLIDFCCKAGIIQHVQTRWEFTQPALELALAAEFISEETNWVSLRPQHRALMRWTAVLISQQATDRRKQAFIQELRRALISTSQLSVLEAADVLAEFGANHVAEARALRAEVMEQLQELVAIGSSRLAELARHKLDCMEASQTAIEDVSEMDTFSDLLIPIEQLQIPSQALAEVLRQLGLPAPAGIEERWLEDRRVLSGLIEGLYQATSPVMKQCCTAWLYRASLLKVLEVHVPEQRWWKLRARSAVEILARCALEPGCDELTRRYIYSILAREVYLLQLWQRGDEFISFVYELLLALDQRLFLVTGLLTKSEWRIMS
jgi:hypothetical protein